MDEDFFNENPQTSLLEPKDIDFFKVIKDVRINKDIRIN